MPKTTIKVKLVGTDGNAFALLGRVRRALKDGGRSDLVPEFITEAMKRDYNHLLQTVMAYVEVE